MPPARCVDQTKSIIAVGREFLAGRKGRAAI